MIRWTTPTQRIRLRGTLNVQPSANIYITLKQGCNSVTIKNPRRHRMSDGNLLLFVSLTQKQTAAFAAGVPVRIQANIIDSSDFRIASSKARAVLGSNLLDEEVTHG